MVIPIETLPGLLRVAFPNARYVVQQAELDVVEWDHPRIVSSFNREDFQPLLDEPGRLLAVDGPHELGCGIQLISGTGPHSGDAKSRSLCGRRMVDLCLPTCFRQQVTCARSAEWPFDLEPLVATKTKLEFLAEAVPGKWRVIFEHDTEVAFAVLEEAAGRVQARPLSVEV